MKIKKKIVKRYQKDGFKGVLTRIPGFVWEESKPLIRRVSGRVIELRGNQVNYHGLRVDLSNKQISPRWKGRFFLDEYEENELELIEEHLPRDKPVIELGGGIGVMSCKINQKLDKSQKHIVLEANPSLIPDLKRNKKLNNSNFEIRNLAYHHKDNEVSFNIHEEFVGGSIQRKTGKTIDIEAVSLGDILEEKGWENAVLVSDIEGGEVGLLKKEKDILEKRIETAIIESHPFIDDSFKELIPNLEKDVIAKKGNTVVLL